MTDKSCFTFYNGLDDYDPLVLVGGIASVLCYLYQCYMYFVVRCPIFMRHPTKLVVYKSLFELLFVQQFLWLPFMKNNFYIDDNCTPSNLSKAFAFVTEFSFLGGETMFFLICWDLRLSYTNPFASFSKYNYLLTSMLVGIVTSIAMVVFISPDLGPSAEGVLWIQNINFNKHTNSVHVLFKFFFFYFWMFIIYSYSIWAVYVLSVKLKEGFSKSLVFRLQILTRTQLYLFLCTLYWSIIFLLQFLTVVVPSGNNKKINTVVAFFFAYRGVYVLFTIIFVNRNEVTWTTLNPFQSLDKQSMLVSNVVQEGLLMKPHLNLALRTEVLYFTTSGIIYAAEACEELVNPKIKPNSGGNIGEYRRDFKYVDESIVYTFNEKTLNEKNDSYHTNSNKSSMATTPSYIAEMIKIQENQKAKVAKMNIQEAEEEAESMGLLDAFRSSTTLGSERLSLLQHDTAAAENEQSAALHVNMAANNVRFGSGSGLQTTGTSNLSNSDKANIEVTDATFRSSVPIVPSRNDNNERSFSQASEFRGSLWSIASGDIDSSEQQRDATINDDHAKTASQRHDNGVVHSAMKAAKFLGLVNSNPGFTLEDFCPISFRKIRLMCGITAQEYCDAFTATSNEVVADSKDSSGSFMFFSKDQKYISKSVPEGDLRALIKMLPHYINHLQVSPHSLLVKIIGAHCITMYGQPLYFIVMKNIFPSSQISERYELKGSWVDRHAVMQDIMRTGGHLDEESALGRNVSGPLYYDNDIMQKITLNPIVANNLASQIRSDVAFLLQQGLMNYSLLVGVRRLRYEVLNDGAGVDDNLADSKTVEDANEIGGGSSSSSSSNDNSGANAKGKKEDEDMFHDGSGGIRAGVIEGPGLYYIGVVDIFEAWTFEKKLDYFFKTYILQKDGAGVTFVDPPTYAKRFFERCVFDLFEGLEEADVDNLYNYKYTNAYNDASNGFFSNNPSTFYGASSQSFMEYTRRTNGNDVNRSSVTSGDPRFSESIP